MNKYETIFIINPNVESENVEKIVEDVQNLITGSEGEVIKVEKWGKKRLAYEVKRNRDGFYVFIIFAADPQFILRLGRYYGLTDEIIKNMTVRFEEPPAEPEEEVESDKEEDKKSETDEDDKGDADDKEGE